MKRFLAALALVAAFFPFSASAQSPWRMTDFRARIVVERDGSLVVTETIGADFLEPRHGIFRYVPYKGEDDAGKKYRLDIDLESVVVDGESTSAETSKEGGNIVWKIGDADVTLEGAHTYVLTYRVEGAVRAFDDFDEVYWNVTGGDWDAPLPAVVADVSLPEIVGAEELLRRSACYTGAYGSSEKDCEFGADGGSVTFVSLSEGSPLTVALGFPKGIVTGPPLWARVLAFVLYFGPWLAPVFVFLFAYRRWRENGDDAPFGAVVAEYEPPAGLTPAETRALLSQSAFARSDLAPTIVDLASRGYLTIEETEKKGLLLKTKEHALVLVKDGRTDTALRPFERELLSALFSGPVGERVAVAELAKSFHTHVQKFTKGVMASLRDRGYFSNDPERVRLVWMGAGIGLVIGGFVLSFLAVPLIASGAILLGFGWFMPKWSSSGHTAAKHAQGYKEFISKVEKYRAPWMEDQNVFFRVLPYALAFGLGAKWAKAFAGMQVQPPSWYHGANVAAWSAAGFEKDLRGWTNAVTAAAVPSSRSGSGGGGFSGGGFGGGGGGSW